MRRFAVRKVGFKIHGNACYAGYQIRTVESLHRKCREDVALGGEFPLLFVAVLILFSISL